MHCMLICKAWAVGDATLSANQHSPPRYSNNSSAYQDLAGWKLLLLGCHGNQMWVPPPILAVSFYPSLFLFSGEAAVQLWRSKGCWDTSPWSPHEWYDLKSRSLGSVCMRVLYQAYLPVSWASTELQKRHRRAEREECEITLVSLVYCAH